MIKHLVKLTLCPIFKPLVLGAILLPLITPSVEARPVVTTRYRYVQGREIPYTTYIYGSPIPSPVPIPSTINQFNSDYSYRDRYDRDYYQDRRGRRSGTIRNSTLINPTIIDSEIEDSVLIDPVIIDSRINRRFPRRSNYGSYGSANGGVRIRFSY